MRLVEHLDEGAPGIDAFDEVDPVEHRAGCPIPFGNDQDIASAELVDRLLEFRPALGGLAGGLLAEDDIAAFGAKSTELAIKVLMGRTDSRVADFPHLVSIQIC